MLSTLTSPNSSEVPFPYPPDNDATVLHPRIQVAKHMERLKMSLPSGSKETGLQILQRMAAGDDGWLNSPIRHNTTEEHLETPQWLKDLQKMSIKEPPKIDEEQLQKVKENIDKIQPSGISNASQEQSLLNTEYVEALMPLSSSALHVMETSPEATTQQVNETANEIIVEAPTSFMPALQTLSPATPVIEKTVPDPVTPIPPVLALKSVPDFKKYQERPSDSSAKTKVTLYQIKDEEKPLDAMNLAVNKHKRDGKGEPSYIKISKHFTYPLNNDMQAVHGMPFYTHYPHITASGQVTGIPIVIDKMFSETSRIIICVS